MTSLTIILEKLNFLNVDLSNGLSREKTCEELRIISIELLENIEDINIKKINSIDIEYKVIGKDS